jgi:DNA-directed RNA polymerase, sigma subunit (sigma70/sigma32)
MRKGFSNGKEATLDEVSEQLNMTKERVRQIEQRAMQKLKKVMRKIKTYNRRKNIDKKWTRFQRNC